MNTPLLAGTQYSGRLTCGPTKLTWTEDFVNLVNMHDVHPMAVVLLQPLVFLLQPPKAAPVVPHAPASCGWLCCRGGLTAPYYSHCWPGPAATAASHRSRTSEPSYSSPRGLPLPCLPRLRVVPFLGLAVVHRLGALGAAWSTWSTTFHRKSTVRGEADSWVHGHSPVFL